MSSVLFLAFGICILLMSLWLSNFYNADTWFERHQQQEEMQWISKENQALMQFAEEMHRKKLAGEREGEKDEPDTKINT